MTGAAWAMLLSTWGLIAYFTGRFFWMVLTTPPGGGAGDTESSPEQP